MTETQTLRIEHLTKGGFNRKRIRFLVYGESGAGKTTFASTWPKPLFLNMDDGLASVRNPIDHIFIDDWTGLGDVFIWLENNPDHGYETIVWDSLNEAQVLAMEYTLIEFPEIRRSYGSLPALSDYGKAINDFLSMVRSYKSLPQHLVLIAQVATKSFETDAVKPLMTGKQTSDSVCRMMDEIGYLYRGEGQSNPRLMAFDATTYVTKDRSGVLPPVLEDPTFDSLDVLWKSLDESSTRKARSK